MSNIDLINNISQEDFYEMFGTCCVSKNWIQGFLNSRPFTNSKELFEKAEKVWFELGTDDFLEAFEGHPQIGDVNTLKEKYRNTATLAGDEQSGVNEASDEIIKELSEYNKKYLTKFGFIFIVCASGKSAIEMLELLKERFDNNRGDEIKLAAIEQNKITKIRLEKLL